ncbi:hypothetical protein N9X14_00570 [bacterium]|nr:hypothetical protein [bacterium]
MYGLNLDFLWDFLGIETPFLDWLWQTFVYLTMLIAVMSFLMMVGFMKNLRDKIYENKILKYIFLGVGNTVLIILIIIYGGGMLLGLFGGIYQFFT